MRRDGEMATHDSARRPPGKGGAGGYVEAVGGKCEYIREEEGYYVALGSELDD